MPAAEIEILNSGTHLERLFLEWTRIGRDRLPGDPDRPVTAREIIAQFDETGESRLGIESIKLLIEQEGLSSGEPALARQAEALADAFLDAGFADIQPPGTKLLDRGRELILANF